VAQDIKAAVDMAYCVEPEFKDGCIHRLTLRNFKGRFAPGRHLGLEFVPKKGFFACDVADQRAARDAMQAVIEIVEANPGSNQSQIVSLAQQAGIGKHQVEDCLKDGPFNRDRGNRNEWLYTLAEQPQIPNLPPPIEEGNREIQPSLLR
jgi:hypothetical protein